MNEKEIRELMHNVFNLAIHESRRHGDAKWTVKELNDTEKSIIDYVLGAHKRERCVRIAKSIYDWVKDNFGESEADDPSWNIQLLACHIDEELDK